MLYEVFWGLKFESVIPRLVQAIRIFTSTMHGIKYTMNS